MNIDPMFELENTQQKPETDPTSSPMRSHSYFYKIEFTSG